MTQPQTQQYNDDVILHIIVIISILTTELISCFTPSPKKLLSPSVTLPSQKKKGPSSSKQTSTLIQRESSLETSAPTPKTAASTATSMASSSSTGNPSTLTKTSRAGTKSQATKTSRSGRSTASASPQVMTKLNQTTPTAGLGFSA